MTDWLGMLAPPRTPRPEREGPGVPAVVHYRQGNGDRGRDADGPGQADGDGAGNARGRSTRDGRRDEHRAAGRIGEPDRPDGVPPTALVEARHAAPLLFREVVDRLELHDFEPPLSHG